MKTSDWIIALIWLLISAQVGMIIGAFGYANEGILVIMTAVITLVISLFMVLSLEEKL